MKKRVCFLHTRFFSYIKLNRTNTFMLVLLFFII